MPLPTITSGRSADFRASTAASTEPGSAYVRGASGQRSLNAISDSSMRPEMTSLAKSRYTAPGRPYMLVRTACST